MLTSPKTFVPFVELLGSSLFHAISLLSLGSNKSIIPAPQRKISNDRLNSVISESSRIGIVLIGKASSFPSKWLLETQSHQVAFDFLHALTNIAKIGHILCMIWEQISILSFGKATYAKDSGYLSLICVFGKRKLPRIGPEYSA
jgi:hypothetical protein